MRINKKIVAFLICLLLVLPTAISSGITYMAVNKIEKKAISAETEVPEGKMELEDLAEKMFVEFLPTTYDYFMAYSPIIHYYFEGYHSSLFVFFEINYPPPEFV